VNRGRNSQSLRSAMIAVGLVAAGACSKGGKQDQGKPTAEACIPADSATAKSRRGGEAKRASKLAVYIDGSQSMAGFNAATTRELRALGDLLALIQSRSSGYKDVNYYAFGSQIRPIPAENAQQYATTAPFSCKGCDNRESRLDAVLNAAVDAGPDTLSVVITDLWLDNRSFAGSPQVALGQPLRRALGNGSAVGVIGIMAPFNGAVYDVPGIGTYRGASELPLYALAIGPEEDVAALQIALAQSGGPSFASARMRYSLFSTAPNNPFIATQLRAVGAGASPANVLPARAVQGLPQYSIDSNVARAQKGQLGRTIDVLETLRAGLVWRGEIAERTDVWRLIDAENLQACAPGTWQRISAIPGLWKPRGSSDRATFSFGHEISRQLRPGNIYFLETHLGSNGIGVPNVANQWMREWALDEANASSLVEAGRGPFKTLNLADLATIMEQELARQSDNGREAATFSFILKVER